MLCKRRECCKNERGWQQGSCESSDSAVTAWKRAQSAPTQRCNYLCPRVDARIPNQNLSPDSNFSDIGNYFWVMELTHGGKTELLWGWGHPDLTGTGTPSGPAANSYWKRWEGTDTHVLDFTADWALPPEREKESVCVCACTRIHSNTKTEKKKTHRINKAGVKTNGALWERVWSLMSAWRRQPDTQDNMCVRAHVCVCECGGEAQWCIYVYWSATRNFIQTHWTALKHTHKSATSKT